ncbi:MAG: DUF2764 family protein [Chlamydiales bacterium]|nr:DUF2764 family protein [Chlamydiales bacterium]
MSQYCFLQTVLPPLVFDSDPLISFEELMNLFEMNLSKDDLKKVALIKKVFDLRNLVELSTQSHLFPYGNLQKNELQDAISDKEFFDYEVFEFLSEHETPVEMRKHFYQLLTKFFQRQLQETTGFLLCFFTFEHHLRIAIAGYRAKKEGRDLVKELIFEDINDPFVMQILIQKDSASFEFPYEFQDLQKILTETSTPEEEYKAVLKYRFDYFMNDIYQKNFSIDPLLAYMVQLIYLEMLHKLEQIKGEEIINHLVRNIG